MNQLFNKVVFRALGETINTSSDISQPSQIRSSVVPGKGSMCEQWGGTEDLIGQAGELTNCHHMTELLGLVVY